MFETPTLDIQELRSVLTDAGHTAVGFATMAAKKANDVRLDLTERYEEQTNDLRSNLLTVVERLADVRTMVEARVEPVTRTITDRLPAPARKVVESMTDSVKDAQDKAHQLVVSALTVETSKPASAKASSVKTVSVKTVKTAVKTATTKPVAKKPVARTAAKTSTVKASAAKTATKKPAAKKTAVKKTARKAA